MAVITSFLSKYIFPKKKKMTFLQDVESVLTIGKVIGCVFFDVNGASKWAILAYALQFCLYVVYLCCIPIAGRFYNNLPNVTTMLIFSELVYFFTNVTVTLSRPIYYFLQRKQYKSLLLEIDKLCLRLRPDYSLRYERDLKLLRIISIIAIKMIVYTLLRFYTTLDVLSFQSHVTFTLGLCFCGTNDFIDYSVLKHLRNVFRLINEEFETFRILEYDRIKYNARRIRHYAFFHRKASKIAHRFNLLISPSVIGSIAVGASMAVMLIHYSTISLMTLWNHGIADVSFVAFSYAYVAILWIKFCVMVRVWTNVEKEAHKTATYVHDIWNHLASKDDIDQRTKHLQLIALQLYNNKLSFTAYGFFALDWTLLQRVIAAVTTYVVILIQFEVSSGPRNTFVNATNATL